MQRFLDVFGAPSPVTSARKSPSSSASRAKRPNRSCCRTGAVLGGLVTWVWFVRPEVMRFYMLNKTGGCDQVTHENGYVYVMSGKMGIILPIS